MKGCVFILSIVLSFLSVTTVEAKSYQVGLIAEQYIKNGDGTLTIVNPYYQRSNGYYYNIHTESSADEICRLANRKEAVKLQDGSFFKVGSKVRSNSILEFLRQEGNNYLMVKVESFAVAVGKHYPDWDASPISHVVCR